MSKFKKLALGALGLAPFAVFAEGESSSGIDTVITQVQSGLTSMADKILVAVGAVILACLGFWGLKALVRWARTHFGK